MDNDYCDSFPSFSCFRIIFTDLISLTAVILTLICCFRIIKFYKYFVFELLPLSTALLQALFEFLHNFLSKSLKLLFTSFYLEVITFCLVTFSFIRIYFSLKPLPLYEKISHIFFLLFPLFLTIVFVLAMADIPNSMDCSNKLGTYWFIFVIAGFFTALLCVGFGSLLLKEMTKFEKNIAPTTLSTKSVIMTIFSDQTYLKQQKRNIFLLIICLLMESMFVFIWDLLSESVWTDNILCDDDEIEAIDRLGDAYLLLRTCFALIPCYMMLYVFYYIPIGKHQMKQIEDVHFGNVTETMTAGLKRNYENSILENFDLKSNSESMQHGGILERMH